MCIQEIYILSSESSEWLNQPIWKNVRQFWSIFPIAWKKSLKTPPRNKKLPPHWSENPFILTKPFLQTRSRTPPPFPPKQVPCTHLGQHKGSRQRHPPQPGCTWHRRSWVYTTFTMLSINQKNPRTSTLLFMVIQRYVASAYRFSGKESSRTITGRTSLLKLLGTFGLLTNGFP